MEKREARAVSKDDNVHGWGGQRWIETGDTHGMKDGPTLTNTEGAC